MLGTFLAVMLALALWPAIVLSWSIALYVIAVLIQVPRIRRRYGGVLSAETAKWFWLILGITVLGLVAGSILVFQAPFSNWPTSLEAKPVALIGLWISGWSTFAFVAVTELTSAKARRHEEVALEEVLRDSWWDQGAAA